LWSRNWGGWYNGYGPAWGGARWNYLWNNYPAAMAFGATMWGLNSVAYSMGVGNYYNPYATGPVYYNNQPIANYAQPVVGDPTYEAAYADVGTGDPLTQTFDQARTAFHANQFDQALQLADQALSQAPRDAAINEFRSLCLFALGQYQESAAAIHSVLAAGPGWDWTTMSSLYSSNDVYTTQLRKLETAAAADPQSADERFLLAYHYLTCDQKDAAVSTLKQVVQLEPKDQLSADLLKMYGPPIASPPTLAAAPPDLAKPNWPPEKLQGDWKAKQGDGQFDLNLGADDAFTWKFDRDGEPQSVTGAYAVRGDNLVMQPDTGGTMLSQIALADDRTLLFTPIGDAERLTFHK
jgi:tetratricopeptide (TPR) repeat protein